MEMLVRALAASIGDRRRMGRWESGCCPNQGGINLEFNCVAISMTVENRFMGMVEYHVGKAARQWALICCWRLPSMGAEKRSSWLPFDGISEVWRSE